MRWSPKSARNNTRRCLKLPSCFASLEALVKGTLSGRVLGWLPGEEAQAFERARAVVLNDQGEGAAAEGTYREQFKKAFGMDLEKLSRDETINLVAKAVADYCRT